MRPKLAFNRPDDFQTPDYAITPLLPYLRRDWRIWECAAGKGNIAAYFGRMGFDVIATDIKDGRDFLTWEPDRFDCVITNPPYTIKQQFLERAYQLGKPFAFLLPLTTFESEKRQALFDKHGLEVIFLNRRINFETPSGKGSGSWFATAWFTWGLSVGKPMTFLKIDRPLTQAQPALVVGE